MKKPWEPPGGIEQAAEVIRETEGNLAHCARKFGISRTTFNRYVNERATLCHVVTEAREAMKDNVESKLYEKALAGEAWAVCFFLKTQAKDRGYVERQEMTGAEGEPLIPITTVRMHEATEGDGE